jgi:hypothetical protein
VRRSSRADSPDTIEITFAVDGGADNLIRAEKHERTLQRQGVQALLTPQVLSGAAALLLFGELPGLPQLAGAAHGKSS